MRKYTIKRKFCLATALSRQPSRARVTYHIILLSTVLSTTTGHIGFGITCGQSAAYPTLPYTLWQYLILHGRYSTYILHPCKMNSNVLERKQIWFTNFTQAHCGLDWIRNRKQEHFIWSALCHHEARRFSDEFHHETVIIELKNGSQVCGNLDLKIYIPGIYLFCFLLAPRGAQSQTLNNSVHFTLFMML